MHGACLSVTGLRSYTWYDLYVQPFHRSAEGASSNVVRERTEDDGILVFLREIFATKLLPCLVLLCYYSVFKKNIIHSSLFTLFCCSFPAIS